MQTPIFCKALSICAAGVLIATAGAGCASKPILATQAPRSVCSIEVLDESDPPDAELTRPGEQPDGVTVLPPTYEARWREDRSGHGHWVFRRVTDASRRLHPNLKPALMTQEMGLVLASNMRTQQQIVAQQAQVIAALREVQAQAAETRGEIATIGKTYIEQETEKRQQRAKPVPPPIPSKITAPSTPSKAQAPNQPKPQKEEGADGNTPEDYGE